MLTRDDLEQIRNVIREETRVIVKEEVKSEVSLQIKPVNRKLNRLQKDITWIMHDYTNAIVHVRKRVERLEKHVGFSS